MNTQIRKLMEKYEKIKNQSEIKFKDVKELEILFGRTIEKMDELQERGDKFKEKYLKEKEKNK